MSNKQRRSIRNRPPGRPSIPTAKLFHNLSTEAAEQRHVQMVLDIMPSRPLTEAEGNILVDKIKEVIDGFDTPLAANVNINSHKVNDCTVISCVYLEPLVAELDKMHHDEKGTEH